jgi:methionyl-tRNA formyltransferase
VRLIFAGTPEFARVALENLRAAGHEIALVLTQPDRPAGRGMKLQASAVKQYALDQGLPIAQPRSLRVDGKYPEDAAAARLTMQAARADAMVVAAYGLILPQWVLEVPVHGCFNIHASLLPRWRGAAPIQRAIEAGDAETAVTIMQMDAGLDTGDMLLAHTTPIVAGDTAGSLQDRLAVLGGRLMVLALELAAGGALKPVRQALDGVTYAHKIEKHEAVIDWTQPAQVLSQRVRAFNPFPGASSTLNGDTFKIWRVVAGPGIPPEDAPCGTILAVGPEGIAVVAMKSVAVITELQRAGAKRLGLADFLRGIDLRPGMVFEKHGLLPLPSRA